MEEKEKITNKENTETKSLMIETGKGKKKRKKGIVALVSGVLVLGVVAGAGYGVFHHYFRLLGRLETPEPNSTDESDRRRLRSVSADGVKP